MANPMALEQPLMAAPGVAPPPVAIISDADALELFKKCKRESFENRWVWERGWMRNIHHVNNRQWVEYLRHSNEWRDVKLAKWFPKPTNTKIAEGVQALRAMFASVNIGVDVRPAGTDPVNVAVAAVADDMAPVLHEVHQMDEVLNEAHFWFIVTGNVFLHTYLERDVRHGVTMQEGQHPVTGEPVQTSVPNGKGVTIALSPFELAFPNTYARFSDVPYVIRLQWRTKSYYTNHPTLKAQTANVKWSKAPTEQALRLFRTLPYQTDMGVSPFMGGASGGTDNNDEEGSAEYELNFRPCDQFPEGLVLRILGDGNPIVLHLEEDEAIPGPLPYKAQDGTPVFTFSHAAFEQRGGRVYGSSPCDGVVATSNRLNQLDSFVLMVANRMANPLWLVPKGAEIEKFTGEPGLVVRWNPLTVGGNAKPERVDGLGPNPSLFTIREQYIADIESGMGTFDVLKGGKPPGVGSFSGLQLMVERGQSRFASAFKSLGGLYKDWFKFALEIEREFGPDERTHNVLGPTRSWTQKQFKNAQLQGCFDVIVEDGSMAPKTTLGIRAAVEHLNSLGFLDPHDPDQKYKVLQLFGQGGLSPSLDVHMQAALRKQQAFEEWAANPQAQQKSFVLAQADMQKYQAEVAAVPPPSADGQVPILAPPPSITKQTPLAWKGWYDPHIHKQEFLKWANSDSIVMLLQQNPALEQLLTAHLAEIDAALQAALMASMPPTPNPGGGGIGAGQAMKNSNAESGGSQNAGNHTAKTG